MEHDAMTVAASVAEPLRFGEVFEHHHRVIWTYLARMAGRDAADELTSAVFLTAFERRAGYDPEQGRVRSWLYGIAGNHLRTHLRTQDRARQAFLRAAGRVDAVGPREDLIDDVDDLVRAVPRVVDALARLDRDQRELIALAAWEELTYPEIAEVLGIPVGTVRSRLSRVRARLRDELGMDPAPGRPGTRPATNHRTNDRTRK